MKGITSEIIAEVRSRANLFEIVSENVVLKRAGKDYRGLCPFHNEKTPSFHVNLEKGIYKCFGCGEGGDVFAFLQKIKGIDFVEVVKELAQRYGIQLVETVEEQQESDKRSLMLLLYQQASEYYMRVLHDPVQGAIARQYLESRGLSEEIITQFKLGYAPNSWDGLLHYLSDANKVSPVSLTEAGLVRRRQEGGSFFDLFRNRLMIPICDEQGRVIAFGGRTLGDDQVKYLNSPETMIYSKGHNLFAFNLAKEHIKANDSVIVVEGYFDAITPHQFGYRNTVATLGTALTEKQAKMLVRYTDSKKVYLAFDADSAGQKAVERGVETLNQVAEGIGIELRVIKIPDGKDPDECLRKDPEHFEQAIKAAPRLIDYQLDTALYPLNTQSHSGKIEAAQRIVPILAQIRNAVARGEYVRQMALRLQIREEELLADVGQFRTQAGLTTRAGIAGRAHENKTNLSRVARRSPVLDGTLEAERRLLALFLTTKADYEQAQKHIGEDDFITPAHRFIKVSIDGIDSSFNNVEDLQHKLMDRVALDKEASAALIEIILKAEEINRQKAPVEIVLREARARIIRERLRRMTRQLSASLTENVADGELKSLQSKIAELTKLESVILSTVSSMTELDDLKHKIEEIISPLEQFAQLETKV